MLEKILSFFARLWSVKEFDPDKDDPPDVIACVTYGLDRERNLAKFTEAVVVRAASIAKNFPQAVIVFGSAVFPTSRGVSDTSEIELQLKLKLLETLGVSNRVVYAGQVWTTINEAEFCRDALSANGIFPRRIHNVDGAMHSRSTKYVWRRTFPRAKITFSIISFTLETGRNYMMKLARKPELWVGANVARHAMLCLFGMNFVRRFVQPASE